MLYCPHYYFHFPMKKIFTLLSLFALMFAFRAVTVPAPALALTPFADVKSGDLIRGQAYPAVYYYGADGFRYVFPNDKAYFTWYSNFDSVKWISDTDLQSIQIGGNVTYRPGVKMIKINSDPKTYAVGQGGSLHWVTSEAIAIALYGSDWNKKIDDVPDGFFSNYKSGSDITQATDFTPSSQTASSDTINHDKNLKAASNISIRDGSFSPSSITINAGEAIKWTNTGSSKHSATDKSLNWGTGTLEPGQNFIRYFKTAGTYSYSCSYHPEMEGTIIVQ